MVIYGGFIDMTERETFERTKDELDAIGRRTAHEILDMIDAADSGLAKACIVTTVMSEEWWRGYHTGRDIRATRSCSWKKRRVGI